MKHLLLDDNGTAMPVICVGSQTPIVVDGSVASAASAVISATEDTVVRIWPSADLRILFGTAPTALTTSIPMTAKLPEYFVVKAGHKIAALGGVINIVKHQVA